MNRRAVAGIIILMWIAGIAWMLRRNFGGDPSRRLTEAAIRVQPATFYYSLAFHGKKIGAAASAIDTLPSAIVTEEYYSGRFPSGDSLIPVSARFRATLTRGFRLTNLSLQLDRGGLGSKMSAFVQSDTTLVVTRADSSGPHIVGLSGPVLPPGLVGVALLLGEAPKVGRSERFFVFNPMNAMPERRQVRLGIDSLFTVVDSAESEGPAGWRAAHSDTVRAWRVDGETGGLHAWVDAEGRIVQADAPNGLTLTRTAYELAFERARRK